MFGPREDDRFGSNADVRQPQSNRAEISALSTKVARLTATGKQQTTKLLDIEMSKNHLIVQLAFS